MPVATDVPISPQVLEWAVREGGFSLNEFASRIGVEPDLARKWMGGESKPTTSQFNRIVSVLRRPSAMFFLQSPPASSGVPSELRATPSGSRELSAAELRRVRSARRLQVLLSSWAKESGRRAVDVPSFDTETAPAIAASQFRSWIGVSVEEQRSWRASGEAFRVWRGRLSSLGVLVLVERLSPDGVRGFSSWDPWAPLIAVNSNYNAAARVFSMFHEAGHLVTRSTASCVDLGIVSRTRQPRIERWCEDFAAAALLPEQALRDFIVQSGGGASSNFDLVEATARAFSVSLRATALRIQNLRIVDDPGLYSLVNDRARVSDREKHGRATVPQDRIAIRLGRLGPAVVSEISEAARRGYLGERELRDFIGMNAEEFEDLAVRAAAAEPS